MYLLEYLNADGTFVISAHVIPMTELMDWTITHTPKTN